MSDLAQLTGLNPRYLIRVFRQRTGLTPHRYPTALRVRGAKELLLTDRPLSRVATDLGFCDQAHFTRVFKAHVQVSPAVFRRLSSPSANRDEEVTFLQDPARHSGHDGEATAATPSTSDL